MARERRKFSDEQKAEAVKLVREVGSIGKVARDLDLTESALRNWVVQADVDAGKGADGALTTEEKDNYPVSVMCRVLGVSRSGAHAWRHRPRISARRSADEQLLVTIQKIFLESRGTYGSPRIHAELQFDGTRVGRKRVERLMHANGIAVAIRRPFRSTTDSKHDRPIAPNLLDRQFDPAKPNEV